MIATSWPGQENAVLLPGLERLSRGLLVLGVAAYLMISGMALTSLGIHYTLPGGLLPEKVHPGAYLVFIAFALFLCARGNPVIAVIALTRRYPMVLALFWSVAVAVAYLLVRDGGKDTQPSLVLVETYATAALTAVMLLEAPESYRRYCFTLFMAIVLANTALAIYEALTQTRLTPYLVVAEKGELIEKEFRPSAFFGHPLENALITALFLMNYLGVHRPPLGKLAVIGILIVGLLAEGGRTSMAIALILLAFWAMVSGVRMLLAGRGSYRGILLALLAGSVLPTALFSGAVLAGLGERILANLYWDDSANTRSLLFKVFDHISAEQLLFGVSSTEWTEIKAQTAIRWGVFEIENFWVILMCSMGIAVFAIFAAGLISFVWSFWLRGGFAARLAVVLLTVVCSSNNSLATKSKILTVFAAFTICAASVTDPWGRSEQTSLRDLRLT